MKLICRYSGIELSIFAERYITDSGSKTVRYPNFHGTTITTSEHPFFSLSSQELLSFTKNWSEGKLNEHETRILFLSLLKSTKLFDFQSTAIPTQALIEQEMEEVLKCVLWISNINSAKLQLPTFVISNKSGTHKLEQLSVWIKILNKCRDDWYDRYALSTLRERMEHEEDLLDRLIRSPDRAVSTYAGKLANWAFLASSLSNKTPEDKETRARWLSVFRLKGWDIYNADKDDIYDVLTYMETNLHAHAGTIRAKAVLTHLRSIKDKNENGLARELGLIDGNTFEIIYEDIEIANRKTQALSAPLTEPKDYMIGTPLYPTKVAFLTAKAAWIVSIAEKERVALEVEKKKQEMATEGLDVKTEEETSAEVFLDPDIAEFKKTFPFSGNENENGEQE